MAVSTFWMFMTERTEYQTLEDGLHLLGEFHPGSLNRRRWVQVDKRSPVSEMVEQDGRAKRIIRPHKLRVGCSVDESARSRFSGGRRVREDVVDSLD